MNPWNIWIWPWATTMELHRRAMDSLGDVDERVARDKPEWITPNRVIVDLAALRLRDFSVAQEGRHPTLVVAPFALHDAALADLAPGHSLVETLTDDVVARAVALTLEAPPGETTHWTGALMAKASGVSVSSVQRIWRKHGLQPNRIRQFKLSNDPKFVEKLRDIVGLYVNPPAHAVVLSFDEKSQIQALDRTQPGLPLKKGRAGTMTHDYKTNDTTTLFAAMNVLDGTVIGQNMQRHRHQEFIRFLNAIDAKVPAGKIVHVVLDNYAAHKHPKVLQWLARHRRLLRHAHQAPIETRSVPLRRRPAGRHQQLPP